MSPPSDILFTTLEIDGYYSCGLDGSGSISCWGEFLESQVPNESGYTQIVLDLYDLCAVAADGYVSCRRLTSEYEFPPYYGDFGHIAIETGQACATGTFPGSLVCWLMASGERWEPAGLQTQDPFVDVCLGVPGNGCALTEDGIARCWGYDSPFPPDLAFTQISCGAEHVCGVTAEGELACWGLCRYGRCDVPA